MSIAQVPLEVGNTVLVVRSGEGLDFPNLASRSEFEFLNTTSGSVLLLPPLQQPTAFDQQNDAQLYDFNCAVDATQSDEMDFSAMLSKSGRYGSDDKGALLGRNDLRGRCLFS